MKKENFGINGKKLGAYIKNEMKSQRSLFLHTVEDGNGEQWVYFVSGFLALRVPMWLYRDILQPYTMTDAPEMGQTKGLDGKVRDEKYLIEKVADMFSNSALRPAQDTRFSADIASDGKWKSVQIFSLEDGTPVAVNADYAGIFERGQYVKYEGSSAYAPVIVKGQYVQGVLMPIRIKDELQERMRALCKCFAAPVEHAA
jgi:hypothetical protein